ncbi:DUF4303 domain-containing protein [Vibrio sp. S4M6]|uniref:DUF4303 domain-containing protein n=1 Tax=Vibrio sinus TaxID=2946865 RepID=UPI00202A6779|nr:DUF4303 domain-containing protein [Vibrio sinus]MCL9781878.1 DUF4303 domain-containing protein [Vibrio sinus]
MKINDMQSKLADVLYQECLLHVEKLKIDLKEYTVFSYTFYCSSGCEDIGAAACTREYLDRHGKEKYAPPLWFSEVNACEWDYINKHYNLFGKSGEYVEKIHYLIDNEPEDGEEEIEEVDLDEFTVEELSQFTYDFFSAVMIKVQERLLQDGILSAAPFEESLLLGIQFSDPSEEAERAVKRASKQLNNEKWHRKIVSNYNAVYTHL